MKNFVEFFAGVGLVREGLSDDKWRCEWANDISESKQQTYVANFGSNHFHLGDIWEISKNPDAIPNNVFLYTVSFPCTDLSLAGERRGLSGHESGSVHAMLKILKQKKESNNPPSVIMMENVPGFLTSNNGLDIENIIRTLSAHDYAIDILEIDAVYFTPQSRPRIFIIAVKKEIAKPTMIIKKENPKKWEDIYESNSLLRSNKIKKIISENSDIHWGIFNISSPHKTTLQLKDIIENNLTDDSALWWSPERKNHLLSQMKDAHRKILDQFIKNNEFSYSTVYRRMREGASRAELRTDGIAGCLRTPRGGSSKQILIRAGFNRCMVRLLTPREYARLQGLRDNFILPANANQGYFAMGDAVCVPVIKYISNNILNKIYESCHSTNDSCN